VFVVSFSVKRYFDLDLKSLTILLLDPLGDLPVFAVLRSLISLGRSAVLKYAN
jgi:hypothetical protein